MLARGWSALSKIGVSDKQDISESRYIILTNRFALIASIACFLNVPFLKLFYNTGLLLGPETLAFISGILCLSVLWLNKYGHYSASKVVVSWLPVIILVCVSIFEKKQKFEYLTIQDFYSYRFILMATAIVPILVISSKNIGFLLFNILPSFIGIIFFQVIHKSLGVGIHQMGFGYVDDRLYVFDFVVVLTFLTLLAFLLNQRKVFDEHESELQDQRLKLIENNKELTHKNSFINEQNQEISTQSDRLKSANAALLEAKATIEKQKHLLEDQNVILGNQVDEKTKDLYRVNEELHIRNSELRQFSYTLSHNLKSPVATFQGLLNLMDNSELSPSNKEIMNYLDESVGKMQDVFSDMNKMLDIRNSLYNSIEEINLQDQIDGLHNQFYSELRTNNIGFKYDFNGCKTIRTNQKRFREILYHLISNAIKFRSENRKTSIDIQVRSNGANNALTVMDNGIGIDMKKYASKLFYPYQQFHTQSSGKGLGLYLVKMQAESLGGMVNLESKLDQFTLVTVKLPK